VSRSRAGAVALALLAVVASPWPARAGDRPLELVVANMSPEGSRPDCMREVVRVLRRDDTTIHRVGGDRVRELAGHRRDGTDFTTWQREELEPLVRVMRAETIDAIALVDCRAEEGRADVWVSSPSGGVARMRLARTTIDDARAEWIAQAILMHAWTGFSP